MAEYPYNLRKLLPQAYEDYVVYNLCFDEPLLFPIFAAQAVRTYLDSEHYQKRNILINWTRGDDGVNKFYNYFKTPGLPCYSYSPEDIPVESNRLTIDITSASLEVDNVSSNLVVQWPTRKRALGYFSGKFKNAETILGVDPTSFKELGPSLRERLDRLIVENTAVRIYVAGNHEDSGTLDYFKRYGSRVYFRRRSDSCPIYELLKDSIILGKCTHFLNGGTSPLSRFVRTTLPVE
jgi:hypothetical protein